MLIRVEVVSFENPTLVVGAEEHRTELAMHSEKGTGRRDVDDVLKNSTSENKRKIKWKLESS